MSLPHGCSLQLWVDPRGNMGTARRGEKASRELAAILAGLEGRAKSARGFREAGWGPGPGGSAVGRGASREAEGRPWGCKARRPTRPEDRKGLRQKASAFPLARTSLRDAGTFNRGKLQGQQSACEN